MPMPRVQNNSYSMDTFDQLLVAAFKALFYLHFNENGMIDLPVFFVSIEIIKPGLLRQLN